MKSLARGNIVAMAGLAVAGSVFAAALFRAATFEPASGVAPDDVVPTGEIENQPPAMTLRIPSQAVVSRAEIEFAVAHDPFQPDRERPEPFRLPGERVPETTPPELPPPPEFTMTGVAGMGEGGLALIAAGGEDPRVITVGESLLGYRLERVGATSATMAGQGRTLELQLVEANPRPGTGSARNRRNSRTPVSLNDIRNLGNEVLGVLRQAQQRGATQGEMQAMLQALLLGQRASVRVVDGVIIRDRR